MFPIKNGGSFHSYVKSPEGRVKPQLLYIPQLNWGPALSIPALWRNKYAWDKIDELAMRMFIIIYMSDQELPPDIRIWGIHENSMYSKAVGGHDKVGAPAKLHSPMGNAILLEHVCNPNIDMTCDDHIQCKCKHCKGTSKHYVYVFIYTNYTLCSIFGTCLVCLTIWDPKIWLLIIFPAILGYAPLSDRPKSSNHWLPPYFWWLLYPLVI